MCADVQDLVRSHAVELLDAAVDPRRIAQSLEPIADDLTIPRVFLGASETPSAVLVYGLPIGGAALPGSVSVLEGFRRAAAGWQSVATESGFLDGHRLRSERLEPAIGGHILLLVHGRDTYPQWREAPQVWDFDGSSFKNLWRSERPIYEPYYEIGQGSVEIWHNDFHGELPESRGRGSELHFSIPSRRQASFRFDSDYRTCSWTHGQDCLHDR